MKYLLLAILLTACGAPQIQETQVYKVYLPIASRSVDARFSLQHGWGSECCSAELKTLGLDPTLGGNMHKQLPANDLQGVQPKEWYDWCSDPNNVTEPWCRTLGLTYPPCAWSLAENGWLDANSCAQFILVNPGKSWYIGNEPNCGNGCGGWGFTAQEYASHFHAVYAAIKSLDPTAKVLTAAWIRGACDGWDSTDGAVIDSYFQQWGAMPADAFNAHYYQSGDPFQPDSIAYMQCFLDKLAQKKLEGKVVSDLVRVTEFGWSGFDDIHGTEENVLEFMDYLIPYLKTQPRVERWYWWEWSENSYLIRDGITPAGRCYQRLAAGMSC